MKLIRKELLFASFAVMFFVAVVPAQKLTLDEAVQTALKNNPSIKSAEHQIDYFKEIKKTGTDIGKLSATWMHGQYNSVYRDNNLTLLQNIPFPTTLFNQVQLGREQVFGAEQNLIVQKNNLVFEVRTVYYQLLYLGANKNLLLSQDSLYADFARASALRFKTGESNLLEKTTAETQLMEIQNLKRQNDADINIAQSRLQALLKSETPVDVAEVLAKRSLPTDLDSTLLQNNPTLKLARQEIRINQKFKQVERSRALPDLMVGGFVQSLTGVQSLSGQDVFFPRSHRFAGFQLGLAIPLWIRPHLARAKAASFQEAMTRNNAENYEVMLTGNFAQAERELEKNNATLNYFETSALNNAQLLLSQAKKAFNAGEISYVEFLQALKSSITIRSNYLQALNQYNQSILKIEFLLGKF